MWYLTSSHSQAHPDASILPTQSKPKPSIHVIYGGSIDSQWRCVARLSLIMIRPDFVVGQQLLIRLQARQSLANRWSLTYINPWRCVVLHGRQFLALQFNPWIWLSYRRRVKSGKLICMDFNEACPKDTFLLPLINQIPMRSCVHGYIFSDTRANTYMIVSFLTAPTWKKFLLIAIYYFTEWLEAKVYANI